MIKPLLTWRNPDSTQDINAVSSLLNKGIYEGGALTASGMNLNVTIAPFWAKSSGGLTAYSDATETVTLTPGTTQYLVLFAKYGIPASTVEMQLVSSVTWSTSPNKDYFVTFAKIVTPALATVATAATITYDEAEYTEKLGKSAWRPAVASLAALPIVGNRSGDIRITLDTFTLYVWDAVTLSWSPYGQATNLSEASARGSMGSEFERLSVSTSGLINSVLDDPAAHGSTPTFPGISLPIAETGVPATLDIGAIHAYVHGLYIHEKSQRLTLPAAPGVGSRYDLVYLEVYREVIPSLVGLQYDYSAGGTGTLAAVIAHLESGADATFGPNYRVNSVDLVDSTTVVITRSSLRVQSGVPADTVNPVPAMTSAVNAYANTYTQFTTSDRFAYRAAAPAVYSQYTYAIPLLVLKRTSTEGTFKVFDAVTGARYAFDLAPAATVGKALTDTLATSESASSTLAGLARPSGFLKGTEQPLSVNTGGPGVCRISAPGATVRVKNTVLNVPSSPFTMPAAPAAAGRRDFAYYEIRNTWAADNTSIKLGGDAVRTLPGLGARACAYYGRFIATSVGASTDSDDSMTLLGFSVSSTDPGLWYRAATSDEPTVDGFVYALPVAILHRRNTGAFNFGANPNGSTGRPEGAALTDPEWIHEREIVDLRRAIVRKSNMADIVDRTFSDITTANLRTRLRQHPYAPDVYGTSCLMATVTSSVPVAGAHTMTPVPNAANAHSVWSDSDELIPISYKAVNLNAAQTSADGVFAWNGGGNNGTLTVTAPAGMYIMTANSNLVGPYTNQQYNSSISIGRSFALQYDHTNESILSAPSSVGTITTISTAYDAANNLTQMQIQGTSWGGELTSLVNGTLIFTVWFVKPRAKADAVYANNGSLFGSPTRTYSASHGGVPVNVGAITATVRVLVTGTSFVITQAAVFSLRPDIATASGAIRLYGVAKVRVQGAAPVLRYVRVQNAAGTDVGTERLSVEFANALPANTPVDVTVMCDGDLINQWVEMVPESRQVRGLYSYGLSTSSRIDVDDQSGYSAYPLDRTGTALPSDRMAPMSETSIGAVYGFKSGVAETSNAPVSADTLTMNAPTMPDNVDFMMAAYALAAGPAQPAGVGHIFWYLATDTNGAGVNVPSRMIPGLRTISAVPSYSGLVQTEYAVPHHGPYGPRVMAGDLTSPQDPVTFLTVISRAPTAALALFYETPAYQGITDDAALRSRLRGTIAHIADSLITTEGSNAALVHQAIARLPLPHIRSTLNATGTAAIVLSPSSHRHPDDIVLDAGGAFSVGTLVSEVRNRARRRVSLMRQLPYPAAPSTPRAKGYADASELQHSSVGSRPLVRTVVQRIPGSVGIVATETDAYTVLANTMQMETAASYYYPLSLPAGSVLNTVIIAGSSAPAPGVMTADLYVSMASAYGNVYYRIGSGSYAFVVGEKFQFSIAPLVFNTDDWQRFDTQVLNDYTSFYIDVTSTVLNPTVNAIDVAYVEHMDPILSGIQGAGVYTPVGYEFVATAERGANPQSTMPNDNPGIRKLEGKPVTIPASWSGADDNAATAAVFVPGAVDTTGEWARGVTARGVSLPGAVTLYETGMLGYVPYSGATLRNEYTTVVSNLNLELPPEPPVATAYVNPTFGSFLAPAVARVTPYAIVNGNSDVTVGVATATHAFLGIPPGTGYGIPEGGSTIDGFYPQGRPILEGE